MSILVCLPTRWVSAAATLTRETGVEFNVSSKLHPRYWTCLGTSVFSALSLSSCFPMESECRGQYTPIANATRGRCFPEIADHVTNYPRYCQLAERLPLTWHHQICWYLQPTCSFNSLCDTDLFSAPGKITPGGHVTVDSPDQAELTPMCCSAQKSQPQLLPASVSRTPAAHLGDASE